MIKLYEGDCLEVMKRIPDKSIDMILCDLPYGTTACKWDSIIPFEDLWGGYNRVIKDNGAIVLFGNQPFTTKLIHSNLKAFKYSWIWVKNRPTGAQHSKNRPMGSHEDILVFSNAPMGHVSQLGNKRMTYNPQGVTDSKTKMVTTATFGNITGARPNQLGKSYVSQIGFPNTILNFKKEESHLHPTQKPVELLEYLIKTYTNEGDMVLDNTAGSGSTGVACYNTNRNCILIEKETKYCDIIEKRLNDLL